MSVAFPGTFHGYHFHIRFFPKWQSLAPIVIRRARAVGLTVPDDGAGLEPRATSLAFVGTRWTRFRHGGLRFDVLEERRDLKGEVISAAGNAGEHPTYPFGLATPTAIRGPQSHNELALEMAAVLIPGFYVTEARPLSAAALKLGNTKLLGVEVYTNYLYPLQIAAVLLLVAIIAAISLTLRARKDSKHVHPSEQVKATKADRLRVVSMKPEAVPRDASSAAAPPVGDRR